MTELDDKIAAAFTSCGKQEDVNKVYLTLLRTALFVPVKKEKGSNEEEPFEPLFAKIEGQFFMLAFDTVERLTAWAGDQLNNITYVDIIGRDVIAGINEQVYLGLNYGTEFYKEFTPDEVKRLKMIVVRIDQLRE